MKAREWQAVRVDDATPDMIKVARELGHIVVSTPRTGVVEERAIAKCGTHTWWQCRWCKGFYNAPEKLRGCEECLEKIAQRTAAYQD